MAGQDLDLLAPLGQGQDQFEQEAVELGLGQGVGAGLLDGVLSGDDDEGARSRCIPSQLS